MGGRVGEVGEVGEDGVESRGEVGGEEAWDIGGRGGNGSRYIVFLEPSVSGVLSPPLANPLHYFHDSFEGLQAVWVGLSSEPGPNLLDSVAPVWELC